MRIVGVDALIKLMEVNLNTSSSEVTEKIHTILRPIEYTRIDQIVDVVFTTAEDKELQVEEVAPPELEEALDRRTQQRTPSELIATKKLESIQRLANRESVVIQRRRNSLYSDASDDIHAVVSVSKRYPDGGYWYAYHEEPHRKFLSQGKRSFLLLAMIDKDFCFSVPFELMEKIWPDLYQTVTEKGRVYKHILTYETDGKFKLRIRNAEEGIELNQFKV